MCLGALGRKRIVKIRNSLDRSSRGRFEIAPGLARRLLARRSQLQPRAGSDDQQFDGSRVEAVTSVKTTIGVHDRRHFVLQQQGQHQDLLVRGTSKLIDEARIHVDDLSGECGRLLQDALRQSPGCIQGKFLDGIVVLETTTLPAAAGSAFDHKQGCASAVTGNSIEKSAQDFFLGGPCVNGGHFPQQIGGRRSIAFRCHTGAQIMRQFIENAANNFLTHLREVALQHL